LLATFVVETFGVQAYVIGATAEAAGVKVIDPSLAPAQLIGVVEFKIVKGVKPFKVMLNVSLHPFPLSPIITVYVPATKFDALFVELTFGIQI